MDTSSGSSQEYPSTPGTYNLTTQADGQTVYYTLAFRRATMVTRRSR